jgi:hypothetical protein
MVGILALVLQHDEQAVLRAVELALEAGVATKTHIINVLHRVTDGKAPPTSPIDAPQALRLARERVANVERYDTLRDRGQCHASRSRQCCRRGDAARTQNVRRGPGCR